MLLKRAIRGRQIDVNECLGLLATVHLHLLSSLEHSTIVKTCPGAVAAVFTRAGTVGGARLHWHLGTLKMRSELSPIHQVAVRRRRMRHDAR